jgi:uncharacterized protein YggE
MMTRTVTVTGQGSAKVVPDSAVINVAAVHRARSVDEAFAGVTSAVEAITAKARSFVEPARIGSLGLNVWPAHDNQGRQSGFECRHTMEIRCPSLEVAGPLLTALVAEVGDRLQVEGVALEASDTSAAQATAREAAYADAVARATHLAGLADAALGWPVDISEGGGARPVGRLMAASFAKEDMSFEPGQRAIGASLTVTFALGNE